MYSSKIKKDQGTGVYLAGKIAGTFFLYVFLVFFAYLMVLPFLFMLSTSFKDIQSIFRMPIRWIPNPVKWENYPKVFSLARLDLGYRNSLYIAITSTAGTLITCAMAGYGFCKLRFKGQNVLFGILLVTLMIPMQVTLIPMYMFFRMLNWINTYLPLIVPAVFCNAFGVFMFRQFFFSIPDSLLDAAKIDGCSPPGVFFRIVIPQSKGIFATMGLFSFMNSWNAFLAPLIYIHSKAKFTIPLMISTFRSNNTQANTDWSELMAISCISVIPVLILYIATQKYYVRSIIITGMKN